MKYYTGVGSRETPEAICTLMTNIARKLSSQNYTLRSGGAKGADSAFEEGSVYKDVFLPARFVQIYENSLGVGRVDTYWKPAYDLAELAASVVHPNWGACTEYARLLHTRNVFQVLGYKLDEPSEFVIYYAEEDSKGKVKGGTNTAVQIARLGGIPTNNLFFPAELKQWSTWASK